MMQPGTSVVSDRERSDTISYISEPFSLERYVRPQSEEPQGEHPK